MLNVEGIAFSYGTDRFSFDLSVGRGEILAVIGPSGSGKSTLLQLVGGFLLPTRGTVRIEGADVTWQPPELRPVTTVFQEHNLFPHLTLFDNVALGIAPSLKLNAAARESVLRALAHVQLDGLANRRPGELSGGQRQRVSLARVLVRGKPVLLLDEPLTALGPALRTELLKLIQDLVKEQALAAILVSHHPEDARIAASRTAFLNEGRIHALSDTPLILNNRDDPVIRDYLGNE